MTIHTEKRALAILREWAAAPNEITASPWWAITVRSKIGHRGEIMLAGPYLSRASAQDYLDRHAYRYPKGAGVFCFSGHESPQWRELRNLAVELAKETEP